MTQSKTTFKPAGSAPKSDAVDGEFTLANAPAPAAETPDVSSALQPREADLPAPTSNTSGAFFGGEDEDPDAGDIRHPYVNVVQPTSGDTFKVHGVGNFVLKGDTKLGDTVEVVVVGFSKPRYEEKVRWGQPRGKMFRAIEDVAAYGGTTVWADSKENDKSNSRKSFFDTQRTVLLLVKKPEGVSDERFPLVVDGVAYAPALFVVKGMSYQSIYVNLKNEQLQGLLREGFCTRYVKLVSEKLKNSEAFKVIASVGAVAPAELIAKARELRS